MSEEQGFKGERSRKCLQSTLVALENQRRHFAECRDRLAKGEHVILTSVGVPNEILFAMDIEAIYTPNISALISAKQMSPRYLDLLNSKGYFRDLCRYCSLPLAYFWENENPEDGPYGGIPRPSAIIMEVEDDPIIRIHELMAKRLGVPVYFWDHTMPLDLPPPDFGKTPEDMETESYRESWRVDYAVKETEGLIAFLETLTGKSLSMARLREVMERSNEQFDYCTKVLDLCAGAPATMTMGDHMASLIFTQFYRGHPLGLQQAKMMYEEVKERVEKGIGICDKERVRLGHYGVPTWFTPGFYDSFIDSHGAPFVFMSYLAITQQWIKRDLSDPLRALASRYAGYTELGLLPPWHAQFFVEWAKKFRLDGVVFQRADSCRLLSGPILLFMKELEKHGIPTFEINSDFVDARDWDDKKMKSQLASFIETIR